MSEATPVLLYRGPIERSRLALVLDAMTDAFQEPVAFRWLVPPPLAQDSPETIERGQRFLDAHRDQIATSSRHDGRLRALPVAARELRRAIGAGAPIVAFQFSAIYYLRFLRRRHPFCWIINGLPDQRLLEPTLRHRLSVRTQWTAARLAPRPQLTMVVSEPMGRLVEQRLGKLEWMAIPASTDPAEFAPRRDLARSYLTYIGSAAPWQGIDLLGDVWRALSQRDPHLRFRVVSRDPEAKVLADAAPHVDMRSAAEPAEVAPLLWEAESGFLLREPNLITSTSTPIKFAEYVAAGVPVIASDIGWDLGDVIRETGCGLLVPPSASHAEIADAYLEFRATGLDEARQGCKAAAELRDRSRGAARFADALRRTHVADG